MSAGDKPAPGHAGGAFFAISAFGLWGVFPLYFMAVDHMPVAEVLAHRIFWSAVLVAAALALRGRLVGIWSLLQDRAVAIRVAASATFVGFNWTVYIWAVTHGHVLESSLGYFINPLVNVLLGAVFLGERHNRLQWIAIAIAAAGVFNQIAFVGSFPWIALSLAFSFGFYGLIRKTAPVEAMSGLLFETAVYTPLAVAFIAYLAYQETGHFGAGWPDSALLVLAGAVTAVPLYLFTEAARRLRLATLGLFQYIAPTLQFMLGVTVFGEPLGPSFLITFALIWTALALYSFSAFRAGKEKESTP